ncbi:hypothetical protein VCRA2119O147_20045 [Vibrio crassostreae]|nr:hypothetical protein VCRA2113O207_120090 [Vibrio crassostreae]CAK1770892.1 hypothetical protein VCRA2118O239_140091 [Vibrio crassostreae]CAK2089487.1 hypothetical protein VCRA2110O135_40124 [Vibrio crassostreae]CAK2140349.1 hypothetical protein VCRA2116O234_40090 [Vibrio crassostreae]CAK2152178.1 hypothetical protein VCRA2113O137_50110 [Vibrio crassostreae]
MIDEITGKQEKITWLVEQIKDLER